MKRYPDILASFLDSLENKVLLHLNTRTTTNQERCTRYFVHIGQSYLGAYSSEKSRPLPPLFARHRVTSEEPTLTAIHYQKPVC